MKKLSRLYVKYIIKTPAVFYLFLLTGVLLFLYLSLSIQLNITQSVGADIVENRVTIDGTYDIQSDVVYLYSDRNDQIYRSKIKQTGYDDGKIVLVIDQPGVLSGTIHADLVVGTQTLFERIFIKAGKGS